MWGIEFQTPAERIYTKTALFKQKIVVRVSNSSGGNLHIISTALGRDLIAFQTPTEKIYTQNRYRRSEIDLAGFKLQRRNLHAAKRRSRNDESAFQPPVEQIYTVYRPGAKIPLNRVSTSSGGNLHSVRNSIFSGYEYLKFIFLPLKFR